MRVNWRKWILGVAALLAGLGLWRVATWEGEGVEAVETREAAREGAARAGAAREGASWFSAVAGAEPGEVVAVVGGAERGEAREVIDPATGLGKRARLVESVALGYAVRVEERVRRDAATGEEETLGVVEMAGDRILLGFREGVTRDRIEAVAARLGGRVLRQVGAGSLYEVVFEIPEGELDVDLVLDRLAVAREDAYVSSVLAYAEPNYIVRASVEPNDPSFADGSLWGLNNVGQSGGVADVDIDAAEGWDRRRSAAGVVVAVIDTGINYLHEDLVANLWINEGEIPGNGIDDDGNGFVDDVHGINAVEGDGDPFDDHGHGTHCAGTIGAVGNNGVGVVGVAWEVELMALKFLRADGSGSVADAVVCVEYAVAMGADILSNSWGGGGYSQALAEAIGMTKEAGVAFVAAAGNSARDTDVTLNYPSGYESSNVVSVAALDRSGLLAPYSNFGVQSVDIGAPGSAILSCWIGGSDAYKTISGTSMATPHVSGVLALVLAEYPDDDLQLNLNRLIYGGVVDDALLDTSSFGRRVNLAGSLGLEEAPFPPVFVSRPKYGYVVPIGSEIVLEVEANSALPLSYRWYLEEELLEGEVGPSLALTGLGLADGGLYRVEVSNDDGVAIARFALEVLEAEPTLSDAVDSDLIALYSYGAAPWEVYVFDSSVGETSIRSGPIGDGRKSALLTLVQGPGEVVFDWRISAEPFYDMGAFLVDGVVVAQLRGDTEWSEFAVTLAEAKSYRLEWIYEKDDSYQLGQDALFVDGLRFRSAAESRPVIVKQPESAVVTPGGSHALEVTALGEGLRYQWSRDGEEIEGAMGATLQISGADGDWEGTYSVRVSNDFGAATSVAVTVEVRHVPVSIVKQPVDVSVTAGRAASLVTQVAGSLPIAYQWYKDGVPLVGQTQTRLSLDDVAMEDAGAYRLQASNSNGASSVVSATVQLTVVDVRLGPVIVSQPVSGYWQEGDGMRLSVAAEGSLPLVYQWFKDGSAVDGANGRSLIFDPLEAGDSGDYYLEVSNAEGSARSEEAEVFVIAGVEEALDLPGQRWRFDGAIYYFAQTEVSRDGEDALQSVESSSFLPEFSEMTTEIEGPTNFSVYWKQDTNFLTSSVALVVDDEVEARLRQVSDWQMARARIGEGRHVVKIEGLHEIGSVIWLDEARIDPAPVIYGEPSPTVLRVGEALELSVDAFGGGTLVYEWFRDGQKLEGESAATLSRSGALESLVGSYRVVVRSAFGTVESAIALVESIASVSEEIGDGSMQLELEGEERPWRPHRLANGEIALRSAVLEAGQTSAFELIAEGPATLVFDLGLVSDDCCSRFWVSINGGPAVVYADAQGLGSEPIMRERALRLEAGANVIRLWFVAGNSAATGSSFAFVDNARATTAPVLTRQPRDARAIEGERVAFNVAALSGSVYQYQWYKDGELLPGKTMASLEIIDAGAEDDGIYVCQVSGSDGQTTDSLPARLKVELGFYDAIELTQGRFRFGMGDWEPKAGAGRAGGDALEYRVPSGGGSSSLALDIDLGAGERRALRFWIRIEGLAEGTTVRVNENGQRQIVFEENSEWREVVLPLGKSGKNTVYWNVNPGWTLAERDLRVWLDGVEVIDAPVVYRSPVSESLGYGGRSALTADVVGHRPMNYVWRQDGGAYLAESSAGSLERDLSFAAVGGYGLIASNGYGQTPELRARLELIEMEFGAAVGAPGQVTTRGSDLWERTTEGARVGAAALRVGGVEAGGWSELQTKLYGSGRLAFEWRMDSPTNRERLYCYINDILVSGIYTSGDWRSFSFNLTEEGAYTVRVRFENQGAALADSGAAWLDGLRFSNEGGQRYAGWRDEVFGQSTELGEAETAWDGDPDGDGIPNFAEYGLALNPLAAQAIPPPRVLTQGNGRLILWEGTASLEAEDVLVGLEVSRDLLRWHPVDSFGVTGEGGATAVQLYRVVAQEDADIPIFVRIGVRYLDGGE